MKTRQKRCVARTRKWPGATPFFAHVCAPKSLRASGVAPGHKGRRRASFHDSRHATCKTNIPENSRPAFSENSKRSFSRMRAY